MIDYSDDLASVIEDIADAGRIVSLVSYVDTGSAWDPELTETRTETSAVPSYFNSNQVDGSSILATDVKYLIAGDVEPAIGMDIEDSGKTYTIKNVWQVKPGNTLILSKVQARL